MLRIVTCLLFIGISTDSAIAQSHVSPGTHGIFSNESSLVSGVPTYSRQTDDENHAMINLKGELLLTKDGEAREIPRGEVAGFFVDGRKYRYYSDGDNFLPVRGYFEIVEVGDVIIYRQQGIYKSSKKEFHYFSTSLTSDIYRLTARNLKSDPMLRRK